MFRFPKKKSIAPQTATTQQDVSHKLSEPEEKTVALLDVDNTLVFTDGSLNQKLLDALKACDIKDICLFTSMSFKAMWEEEASPEQTTFTRYDLVKKLTELGFTVHAVITPIDPVYGDKPGSAYKDMLEPQYERRKNVADVGREKDLEGKKFRDDPQYMIDQVRWEMYDVRMDFVNHAIKGRIDNSTVGYLEAQINRISMYIHYSLLFPEAQNMESYTHLSPEHLRQIEEMQEWIKIAKEHCKNLSAIVTSTEPNMTFESRSQKAVDYILENVDWVKESPWIAKLNVSEHGIRQQWDKGSMFAYASEFDLVKKADKLVFFDDKEVCLKTVEEVHKELGDTVPPLKGVKVDPKGKSDTQEYYEDKLLSAVPLSNDTKCKILERHLDKIEKEYSQYKSNLKKSSILHQPIFNLLKKDPNKDHLLQKKNEFAAKLKEYVESLPTDQEKIKAYNRYRESPLLEYERSRFNKTDPINVINREIKVLKAKNMQPNVNADIDFDNIVTRKRR